MMLLHANIELQELAQEPERFDFLKGAVNFVTRIDEVHPSEENDSHYIFLIWCKPEDTDVLRDKIVINITRLRTHPGWLYIVPPNTGDGLIIVNTWI